MKISLPIPSKTLLALACAATVFAVQPAAAQLATNVICNGCVGSTDIANGDVRNQDLANNAVNSAKVQNGTLTGADVANNSLTGSDVSGNSVPSSDLSNEAGADGTGGNQSFALSPADIAVRQVTITAPSAGRVIVNASGYFFFSPSGIGRCSITTGGTIDFNNLIYSRSSGGSESDAWGATRIYIQAANTTTYRLVCDEFNGTVSVADTQLNAIFVPSTY